MGQLARTAMIAGIGVSSAVGFYELISHTDYSSDLPEHNATVKLCAQSLGASAVKTENLPATCTLYENDFVQQITTTEVLLPDGSDHQTSHTIYTLPSKSVFLSKEIEIPESQSSSLLMGSVAVGTGMSFLLVAAGVGRYRNNALNSEATA